MKKKIIHIQTHFRMNGCAPGLALIEAWVNTELRLIAVINSNVYRDPIL